MKTVHLVCACRPNFMKIAPLYHALKKTDWCEPVLVHVRQHTDKSMTTDIQRELGLPLVTQFESYEAALGFLGQPDAVVVPGDVNVSADSAITASRRGIPVVHLEAGLRSGDRSMPEEINRVVIDHVSDLLWTSEDSGDWNLAVEGVKRERVNSVGNIMIDTLEMMRPKIEAMSVRKGHYAVATLHRPSNVDDKGKLLALLVYLQGVTELMPVFFPCHPRTLQRMREFGFTNGSMHLLPPLPYVEFMALVKNATIVITDSGGVQEETSYLGVPCATVRENTERPITISHGTNELIRPEQIVGAAREALAGRWKKGGPIPRWDGNTALACVDALKNFLLPQKGLEHE